MTDVPIGVLAGLPSISLHYIGDHELISQEMLCLLNGTKKIVITVPKGIEVEVRNYD